MSSELDFPGTISRGQTGINAKHFQEWLSLNGFALAVDGQFGPATEQAVKRFQTAKQLQPTGIVDQATFDLLVSPMSRAVAPLPSNGMSFNDLIIRNAKQHLAEHPMEVGGQNRGPWVRLYMDGNEGVNWPWCAGFVSFILGQAADSLQVKTPVVKTYSCDILASDAQKKQLFVPGSSFNPHNATLAPGCLFLIERSANDWEHTGIVTEFDAETIQTIEGNTNDEGSRDGFEVCARTRGYSGKDFILIQ